MSEPKSVTLELVITRLERVTMQLERLLLLVIADTQDRQLRDQERAKADVAKPPI